MFSHAPWCGICKTIGPEYERAAELIANLSLGVTLARIDGPEFKAVADRYEVTSLPDFILFRGGAHEDFPTLTTAEGYVAGTCASGWTGRASMLTVHSTRVVVISVSTTVTTQD